MASPKSTFRRVVTYGFAGIGAVLLLVVAALFLITLPPGERIVRGIIEDQLSSALYQPVRIGRFETNLISRVRLENVRIPAHEPDSGGIFINEVEVHYRLWPLLRRTLDIRSIHLDSAEITIMHDSIQGYNLALLDSLVVAPDSAQADDQGGFETKIGPVELRRLDARYADNMISLDARLPGVSLRTDTTDSAGMTFTIGSEPGVVQYGGLPPEDVRLSGRGQWSDSLVIVDTLSLDLERLRFGLRGAIPMDEDSPIDATAGLAGDPSALVASVRDWLEIPGLATQGPVAITIEISGERAFPQGLVRAELPTIQTEQATIRAGYLLAHATLDTLTIDSLYAEALGGAFSARGHMGVDTVLNGQLTLTIESVDLPEIWQVMYDSASAYDGQLSGTATLDMNGNDWTAWDMTADLRATDLVYGLAPLDDLDVNASLAAGRAKLGIQQEQLTIDADVNLADSVLDGRINADIRDLAPLAGWLNLDQAQGSLQAEAELSGTFANPTIDAVVTGRNLAVQGIPADTVLAVVRWADTSLFVENLRARGAARSQSLDQPLFGVDSLLGSARYEASVSGRLDSLVGDISVDVTGVSFGQYAIDSGTAMVRMNGQRAILDSLIIARDDLLVQGRGFYNLTTGDGALTAEAVSLSALDEKNGDDEVDNLQTINPVAAQLESQFRIVDTSQFSMTAVGSVSNLAALESFLNDTLSLGGALKFEVSASGPLNSRAGIQAQLLVEVDQPQYDDLVLDSVRLAVSLAEGTLRVDKLGAFAEDQSLVGEGSVHLAEDTAGALTVAEQSRLQGSLRVTNLDLRMVQPFLPEGSSLGGIARADLRWDGTLDNPKVRGDLSLENGRYAWVSAGEEEVIDEITIAGTVRDSTLTLHRAEAQIAGRPVNVTGTMTLVRAERVVTDLAVNVGEFPAIIARGSLSAERLDFTATVDSLNLEIIQPFVPDVERLEGIMTGTVDISGSAEKPIVDGRLEARDVTLQYALIDRPFTDGYFAARFTGEDATIDTMSAKMKDGWVTGSGTFAFDSSGIADIDMRFFGRDLEFTAIEDVEVIVDSAKFDYQFVDDYFLLTGVVDLGETRYKKDFQLTDLLTRTQEVREVETALPVFMARTRLDIRLTGSDSLWIDNNLANFRVNAEMQIMGFLSLPQVSGRLSADEGYVLYLDRKFDLTEGVAFFTDPNQINPEITLHAETEVTSYRQAEPTTYEINLNVTGRLQDPTVELTSEPPLTQPDIVAVLTLGATRGELAGQTGDILQERAEVIASQQISGFASEQVGNLLGLDRVMVRGNIFSGNDTTGPEIIAAERISDDVTLEYRTTVGHLNDQQVSVNWQIHRRWLLEGTTNRTGASSLNLTYVLRMR